MNELLRNEQPKYQLAILELLIAISKQQQNYRLNEKGPELNVYHDYTFLGQLSSQDDYVRLIYCSQRSTLIRIKDDTYSTMRIRSLFDDGIEQILIYRLRDLYPTQHEIERNILGYHIDHQLVGIDNKALLRGNESFIRTYRAKSDRIGNLQTAEGVEQVKSLVANWQPIVF